MRPRFLRSGEAPPPGALVVDAGIRGGAATYSHWRGADPCPLPLRDDTSTGMLVRAAADPRRWLEPYALACNDHIDADGLLALALACRPGLAAEHGARCIAAAEAGDFSAWTGEPGYRLMLRLHQLIRAHRGTGAGWEQRCCDEAVDRLHQLIAEADLPDPERDRQVARVLAARERLRLGERCAVTRSPRLVTIRWRGELGRSGDTFTGVDEAEDLPVWALDAVATDSAFQLLLMEGGDGCQAWLDAPRHSWAETVRRPAVPWPDLAPLRERLAGEEPGGCRWLARPEAAVAGFTCLLASADAANRPAPSRLAPERIRVLAEAALA